MMTMTVQPKPKPPFRAQDVTAEMALQLAGYNQVMLRGASEYGAGLRPPCYFVDFASAEEAIRTMLGNVEIRELWIGVQRAAERELALFFGTDERVRKILQERKVSKVVSHTASCSGQIQHLVFKNPIV